MNTIICPHCKKEFEISQAISEQLEAGIVTREHEKHLKALEEAKRQALEESLKRSREEFSLQLRQAKEDSSAREEQNRKLIEQISQLTKDMSKLRAEKDEVKLDLQKQFEEDKEKLFKEALDKAQEAQHSKLAEKDKQLQDTLKELEEAKRKLTQGSQQLQGEVFEIEFEEMLKSQYPNDVVTPVGKGIKGGDIIHEVWDREGNYAGKILWELKNTKTWSEPWIDKLKVDKRAINADDAVIISEVLPSNMKISGYRNGVWVTRRDFVIPLADTLRYKLIQLLVVKNSLQGKDHKMEALYTYLTGTEFKNRVEAIVEAFSNMQTEIEKEKRYFSNKWARDEKNIRQVIDSTYGMHGDLKAILKAAVPQIAGLDQPQLADGEEQQINIIDGLAD